MVNGPGMLLSKLSLAAESSSRLEDDFHRLLSMHLRGSLMNEASEASCLKLLSSGAPFSATMEPLLVRGVENNKSEATTAEET